MKGAVQSRSVCRICASDRLRQIFCLDNVPLTDELLTQDQLGTEFVHPLAVCRCDCCGVVQTVHDIDMTGYYRDYHYAVSSSDMVRDYMMKLADSTVTTFGLGHGDTVLEVGSGDGYQLSCFQQLGLRVIGFEPSTRLVKTSKERGVPVLQGLFSKASFSQIPDQLLPAKAVVLTYVLDHLPNPVSFLAAVGQVLDPVAGVLIIEVHDLAQIAKRCEACLFQHEHTIYLDASSVQSLLGACGFEIITMDLVPRGERRANSLLVAARLGGGRRAVPLVAQAESVGTDLTGFDIRAKKAYGKLRQYVLDKAAAGIRVAGYGASGRGILSMALSGMTDTTMRYVCDHNNELWGFYTPCSHLRVVSPAELLSDPVQEVVVFSYGYLGEIKCENPEYLARGGGFTSLMEIIE